MTIDEREAEISRLSKKRSETKRRRAELESELRTAGKSLYDIGGALKHVSGGAMGSRADCILSKFATVPEACGLGRLKEMLEELKEVQSRLDQLKHTAAKMEIE